MLFDLRQKVRQCRRAVVAAGQGIGKFTLYNHRNEENQSIFVDRIIESLNHRMVDFERDLWRSSGPTPLLK